MNETIPPLPDDPYAAREAEKYDNPIPSRELILELLQQNGRPLSRADIAEQLEIDDDERLEALRRRLRAMERDGQLLFNRRKQYCLVKNTDLIAGKVLAHPDGFGFLRPEEGGDDLFLSPKEMRALWHNDKVLVRVAGYDRRGRREGAVVDVLARNTQQVVGRLRREHGVTFVVPEQKTIPQEILIPEDQLGEAVKGDIVVAEIIEHPSKHQRPIGRISEVLGKHLAPGMEIEMAIRSHELPHVWPDEVLEEIKNLTEQVPETAKEGRVDLRDLPLLTIDGEDARDFDDAVYARKTPKGFKLWVAIADVSHYVKVGSALDREAKNRSTSVYFPEQVIPMLPEVLSNGLCSLNPDVDRLCMVCEMVIDQNGALIRSRFYDAVMRSCARLTYTEVAGILAGQAKLRKKYQTLTGHLETLHQLYQVLRQARETRGAIDFDSAETRIVFAENRKIERIVPVVRNDAHKLIEECMITANTATAKFLSRQKMPQLLRVHEGPEEEKLTTLRNFLNSVGLSLGGGLKPAPKDYMNLIEQAQHRADAHVIQSVLLRSLSQAVYSPEQKGHFGLALEAYTHFTSPIRRYPDLLTHRAIRHSLAKKKAKTFHYSLTDMTQLGEHCSANERRADEATREVVTWLKCEYMQDKVGEEFTGVVSSVTSFGLFVELSEIYVEGLVHISNLAEDYFHFDADHYQLMGERTGIRYRLGDKVKVKVLRVDLDEKKIDFELCGQRKPAPRRKPRNKKR
ncbi:MAG: ribonuclease R [Methylococcales bacterium]|nr:ribonuclease R [Methylococcales bacterium]